MITQPVPEFLPPCTGLWDPLESSPAFPTVPAPAPKPTHQLSTSMPCQAAPRASPNNHHLLVLRLSCNSLPFRVRQIKWLTSSEYGKMTGRMPLLIKIRLQKDCFHLAHSEERWLPTVLWGVAGRGPGGETGVRPSANSQEGTKTSPQPLKGPWKWILAQLILQIKPQPKPTAWLQPYKIFKQRLPVKHHLESQPTET